MRYSPLSAPKVPSRTQKSARSTRSRPPIPPKKVDFVSSELENALLWGVFFFFENRIIKSWCDTLSMFTAGFQQ